MIRGWQIGENDKRTDNKVTVADKGHKRPKTKNYIDKKQPTEISQILTSSTN